MILLDYEKAILADVISTNCLLITAKGLLKNTVNSLISVYSECNCLVLLVNFEEKMGSNVICVDNSTNSNERMQIYKRGGVISVTTRILIVDMLLDRVPIPIVTGILIKDAHKIAENSLEAFIIKLYRNQNKEGFVKAFSDVPDLFVSGFSKVEKICKYLHVNSLFLWPRFHQTVSTSLGDYEVIEIQLSLTSRMNLIQTALLDIISGIISELNKCLPDCPIKEDTFTLLSDVSQLFQYASSYKAKQLIFDIKSLKKLMNALAAMDPIEFMNYLGTLIALQMIEPSWIGMDSTEVLLNTAKLRIENNDTNPKWKVLSEILDDIFVDNSSQKRILILVQNEKIVNQLKNIVYKGSTVYLKSKKDRCVTVKPTAKRSKTLVNQLIRMPIEAEVEDDLLIGNLSEFYGLLNESVVYIHPTKQIDSILEDIEPSHIILYQPSLESIRSIEAYRARLQVRESLEFPEVYFLIFKGSIEEHSYLTSVRKEKEAFEKLIRIKSMMPLREEEPEEEDLKSPRKILVDMREFRNSLPFILYNSNFRIIPITLQIGDYILSKKICIERKSQSDLISSFTSGRLYSQCLAMKQFACSILLIEYDRSMHFELGNDISVNDLISKMVLLTKSFPDLEIVWSCSLQATVEIFSDLVKDEEEPEESGIENLESDDSKELLLKLPGVTTENVDRLMRKFENLHAILKSDLDILTKEMGTINANRLYSFVNKKFDQ